MSELPPSIASAGEWAPPDACTLPTAERPLRVAEFDDLFAESLDGVVRVGTTGAVLRLVGGADLPHRVRSLADRESDCCSFFTFAVMPGGGGRVDLEVAVPPARADVLAGLLVRAERARAAAGHHTTTGPA